MKLKLFFLICFLGVLSFAPVFSQTHTAVSLDSQVYYVLEQAEIRGLCSPLSGARPYTQGVVIAAINEILNSDNSNKLNAMELEILEQYRDMLAKPKTGIDWQRGAWYSESSLGKNNMPLSANIGVSADIEGSTGLYPSSEEYHFGTEIWLGAYVNGDIGRNISYGLSGEGGLIRVPRNELGTGNTYYNTYPYDPDDPDEDEYVNRKPIVYSEPLTHFPYSYKKRWDGSIYFFENLEGYESWPQNIAGCYNLLAELTASFLDNKLIFRVGRMSHEWGSGPLGSSLVFNQMARPFLGIEGEFNPVPWFGITSFTGILEYYNDDRLGDHGIKASSRTNQNAFSATMLQFRYKNYISFDIVDSVVWPKRFELGYMIPIISSFFYQNNIGDFDNMALTFNLKLQYPGLGNIWFSLFLDEMKLDTNWWVLDRTMLAVQAGVNIQMPFLAFSSIRLSYTMVNPYCYTHNRNFNPWYSEAKPMETSYTSNGVGLGYYLPPNSDELLFRFQTMPAKNLVTFLQYQMIRHGAEYGSGEVDGSSLLSELAPNDRENNPVLKRYFLNDGAYQWRHIIKAGVEWNLPKLPIALYGEAGVVISYFTNIEEDANVTGEPHPYFVTDTIDYPKSTGFVIKIGVRVFSGK
jgi:hypothetical protein